jgi:glutaconate CoA-transferase, subunit A
VNASPVEGMQRFFDEYIHAPKSWNDYLIKLGIHELFDVSMKGRSTFNG